MPAIQTYQAYSIHKGYHTHYKGHQGTVLEVSPGNRSGTVKFQVRCDVHQRPETWKNIPCRAAVHAERSAL